MHQTQKPPFVDFKALKAQVTIEQILARYGLIERMKRSGDNLSGVCPIHKGTNPTQFRVSLTKNCWNCFGDCKAGGNALDFVARMENCGVREAAYKLADWFDLPLNAREGASTGRLPRSVGAPGGTTPQEPAPATTAAQETRQEEVKEASPTVIPVAFNDAPAREPSAVGEPTNKPLGFTLRDLDGNHPYLAKRHLEPATVAEFGLGLCNAGTMIGRIVIPIHNAQGELVAYVGRWPGTPPGDIPRYKLPKGFRKSAEVFNLHRAAKEPADCPLVIVEGFFDALNLWQLGVRRVVALMGSNMSPAQEELIRRHTVPSNRVLIMFDEDDAGRAGRDAVARRLSRFAYVKVHEFPRDGLQPEHLVAEEMGYIFCS